MGSGRAGRCEPRAIASGGSMPIGVTGGGGRLTGLPPLAPLAPLPPLASTGAGLPLTTTAFRGPFAAPFATTAPLRAGAAGRALATTFTGFFGFADFAGRAAFLALGRDADLRWVAMGTSVTY